jgi:stage IV sporulation protein FB
MSERGYLTIARLGGTPLRLHWSLPLGALALTGFRFDPGAWLGLVLVVIAHELGHSVLVRRSRLDVESIDLHGLGGECRFSGYATPWQRAGIAWGGVLAQALLLPIGFWLTPRLEPSVMQRAIATFGMPSLWMIGLNLLPIAPLDGHEAWRLPRMLWQRHRTRRRAARERTEAKARFAPPPRRSLHGARSLADLEPRERVAGEHVELPDEVAAQVERAVRRAYDEREPGK